jgi:acyl-coenzyme A synthetase/AMP-(fatty) acid ligase
MSAFARPESAPVCGRLLPLLADADLARCFAWRNGLGISAGTFVGDVEALAKLLPSAQYAINLCEDRYRFIVSFCAVALAGQTNLLPSSRAPQAIAETLHAYPGSYALTEVALNSASMREFVLPEKLTPTANPSVPQIAADQIVAIAFTSGSTGQPKANVKTWGAFCASSALNATVLCNGADCPAIIATVPPQHMYGLELSVLLPLRSRAAVYTGQPFFPADIVQALRDMPAPRVLVTTPVHLRALLLEAPELPQLAAVVSATAPLDAALANEVERRYTTRVIELFGSTETCVIAHRRTSLDEPWQLYPDIALHPQPGGTLVQAPYFASPTLLQDVVELLPEQRFRLCGRNSDLLEIAGKRASLADLTRRLLAIPGVEDGVVFCLDAQVSSVNRLAALVVAPGLREADLLAALRQAIDPVFLPRPLRCVEKLPRNATGKLPRAALLEALKN